MRRVSSRQRLVSWDAFDATAVDDELDEQEDFVTCYSSSLSRNSSFAASTSTMEDACFLLDQTESAAEVHGGGFVSEFAESMPLRVRKRERPPSICASEEQLLQSLSRTPSSSLTPRSSTGMKKEVSFSDLTPILISAHKWEMTGSSSEQMEHPRLRSSDGRSYMTEKKSSCAYTLATTKFALLTLMDEVQLDIISYLTVSQARTVMLVNKHFFRLLASKEAMTTLWTRWFQQKWPSAAGNDNASTTHFVNLLPSTLPMGVSSPKNVSDHSNSDNQSNNIPNMSMLLGLAARHYPTKINQTLFDARPALRTSPRRRLQLNAATRTSTRESLFRTWQHSRESSSRTAVQYVGPVGTGDRCIRADEPLPRPERVGRSKRAQSSSSSSYSVGNPHGTQKASLLDFLCRGARAVATNGASSSPPWRPFVAPYMTTKTSPMDCNKTTTAQVHLTPRLVSYYEVSILPCPEDSPLQRPTSGLLQPQQQVVDCVAIGVSTSAFPLHSRMPGWDGQSYGYHGDDGGIFHASGDMRRRFGPSFGQGDVVGCGVDYGSTNGIFFTLNGEFLGYGWTGIDSEFLQQDLYPTVGIDSNFPVECNFGERPFCFNLTSIVERQLPLVKACWNSPRGLASSEGRGVVAPSTSSAM